MTTTNEDAGLLTCPFCGAEPQMDESEGVWRQHFVAKCGTPNCYGNPTNRATYGTSKEAAEAWNRRAPSKVQVEAVRATLPQPVIDALRFYAHGHHYNIDDDHQQFDTVSGEPQNWLFSERDDDCTMIEDGSIAKAVLLGGLLGFEEPTEPLEGEVFAAAASGGEKETERG